MAFLIILLALGVLAYFAIQSSYAKLQANPDPYPFEVVSQPLKGTQEIVSNDDGTKLYTLSMGNGTKTVLLAHGYGISMNEWNIIADKLLALGYKVIAFDQRGHGKSTIGSKGISSASMAHDYKTLIEHFQLKDAILVGHSMGTFVGIAFMTTYPEIAKKHLKAAVLLSPFAGEVFVGSPQSRIQILLIKQGIMKPIVNSDLLGAVLFGATLYGDNPSPAGVKTFLQEYRANDQSKLVAILEAFGNESFYNQLNKVSIPVTVICGRKDKTTPPWHTEKLAQDIPNANAIWIDGAGHVLNWESPDRVVQAIQSLA
jgi:pimeloyl-ACP methyl ester carboxylesterase